MSLGLLRKGAQLTQAAKAPRSAYEWAIRFQSTEARPYSDITLNIPRTSTKKIGLQVPTPESIWAAASEQFVQRTQKPADAYTGEPESYTEEIRLFTSILRTKCEGY